VLGRSWLGQTHQASRWVAGFYRSAIKALAVRTLYCEMNRFEINPGQWYIDAFAYDFFGEPDDVGWLVGWKKSTGSPFVLHGMTDLQAIFARHYSAVPPAEVRVASEVVILLLGLRMQELIQTAASHARQSGRLPESIPVLAAVHDSGLVCRCYGQIKPPVTRPEPARPVVPLRARRKRRVEIYRMDGGWDEFHNSLPWDLLDYANESDEERYRNLLARAKPLGKSWKAPRVKLRRRRWRCDLIGLHPHRAVSERTREILLPLLKNTVEFLPLCCAELPGLWLLHPLRHIDLGPKAVHNARAGGNMTAIRRYSFVIDDLKGKHLFGVKQAPGSPARKAGFCFAAADYVSEEFKRAIEINGLQGVVFERVFSSAPQRQLPGFTKD
jgi:hypothetical protein